VDLGSTIFSAGWASGVNAYATVAVLGLLGRAGVGEVPPSLTRNPVIVAASIMFVIEFVVDKFPYLDTTWDVFHTAIRPAIGSYLGVEFAQADHASQVLGGTEGGATALVSHGVKAGIRLAVNTSPEPITNIVVSSLEDIAAIGVTVLIVTHPVIAATIAATLLIAGVITVVLLWRLIRRAWRVWKRQRARRAGSVP